ncbi:MAG: hypothetical protein KJZ70_18120 [Bryobacterales bacterium]|nr:hypothetical protein [Bryobacterales bacterium]
MTETTMMDAAASAYRQTPLTVEGIRRAAGSRAQAREVARHFEALLIQEVVKAARSAGGGGWLGEDAGETSEATAQMGEEFLATAIASGGGFGLAAAFSRSLEATLSPPSKSDDPLPDATLEKT